MNSISQAPRIPVTATCISLLDAVGISASLRLRRRHAVLASTEDAFIVQAAIVLEMCESRYTVRGEALNHNLEGEKESLTASEN
jgi:hypothetical protein